MVIPSFLGSLPTKDVEYVSRSEIPEDRSVQLHVELINFIAQSVKRVIDGMLGLVRAKKSTVSVTMNYRSRTFRASFWLNAPL